MNTQQRFLATSFAFLAAGLGAVSAFAQEATPDTWRDIAGQAQRSAVHAVAVDAVKHDRIAYGEASRDTAEVDLRPSTLTRVQVRAEAIAAREMGLLDTGELSAPALTPAQARAIHMAGVKAVQEHVASASR